MVPIRQMLVDPSKYNLKCPYAMTPTRIVVHNTANDAPAGNEISYMRSNDNEVSFHAAVDDKEIVQGVPFNRNAWHCGDGNGKGNREGIAVEICYSKSGGDKFIAAERNAAEYIAYLLKVHGWGIDKVTKHQDYNGKYCPHRTLDMGWQRFLGMVQGFMGGTKPAAATDLSKYYTYTVRPGDTLSKIAAQYGTTYQHLAALNGIADPNVIRVGQVIKVYGDAPAPAEDKPTVTDMAWRIINGTHGWAGVTGQARRDKLAANGWNADEVQARINELLSDSTPAPAKSISQIVEEVIAGKWGNGQERKDKLRAAGYDPQAVQAEVNKRM